jgi:hypothetical protein
MGPGSGASTLGPGSEAFVVGGDECWKSGIATTTTNTAAAIPESTAKTANLALPARPSRLVRRHVTVHNTLAITGAANRTTTLASGGNTPMRLPAVVSAARPETNPATLSSSRENLALPSGCRPVTKSRPQCLHTSASRVIVPQAGHFLKYASLSGATFLPDFRCTGGGGSSLPDFCDTSLIVLSIPHSRLLCRVGVPGTTKDVANVLENTCGARWRHHMPWSLHHGPVYRLDMRKGRAWCLADGTDV